MRIMHVITGLDIGGAESALCRLVESLGAPEFEHVVISLVGAGCLSDRIRAAGGRLEYLDMRPGRPSVTALLRLRQLVRRERPDVVHGWMHYSNFATTLAVTGFSTPVLWGIRQSLYDMQCEKWLARFVMWMGARFSWKPAWIIYNSITSARQHEAFGYRIEKTRIIPNGFDTKEFRPDAACRDKVRAELNLGTDAFAVGLVARVHPMKDYDNFLHAAALFARGYEKAVFVLVGEGADRNNTVLRGKVEALGLGERVRLCGRRRDISSIYTALDVACCSSWSEAFPNAIGEAMACAVPCVATDVGDVGEIISDTGIVVPPRDSIALCSGWEKFVAMGEGERKRLGQKARQRIVEQYGLDSVSRMCAALYRRTVEMGRV